jgi:hypothetical protein
MDSCSIPLDAGILTANGGKAMKQYIVGIEVVDDVVTQWLAPWKGDPGRTCVEQSAKRYKSVSAATFGLAHARKYHDFPNAEIREISI